MIKPSEVLQRTHTVMRLLESCNEVACKKNGLTQYEASILLYLNNNPKKDTARDIVEFRRLPKANVSKAVESLIQKNLLTRLQDSKDRRYIHLKLTESAMTIIPDLVKAIDKFISVLFSDFTKEERRIYADLNTRIAVNAEKGLYNQ